MYEAPLHYDTLTIEQYQSREASTALHRELYHGKPGMVFDSHDNLVLTGRARIRGEKI